MILHFSYGMPGWMPPKKRVNLYIESTKKFLMNILKFDLKLDIYIYLFPIWFIDFYSYFFSIAGCCWTETSLIVGSMELKIFDHFQKAVGAVVVFLQTKFSSNRSRYVHI